MLDAVLIIGPFCGVSGGGIPRPSEGRGSGGGRRGKLVRRSHPVGRGDEESHAVRPEAAYKVSKA